MTHPRLLLLAAILVSSSNQLQAADSPANPLGLMVAPDGGLLKDGKPYRGVGANFFDLFLRVLHHPDQDSSLAGLRKLGATGIPFVRFAVAYNERDWDVFFRDEAEFFRSFDRVVKTAEEANVGLIPSFFWSFMGFPDRVSEPRDQWGNPDSQTSARMRKCVAAIVERYKNSPAIWAYEFGNEPNLQADLPNAADFRKKGGTERDDLHSKDMVVMLAEFAKEVRRHDSHRPIIAGHSHPRAAAWHNTAEKSWTGDSREQTIEILKRDNPAPLDTIAIHIYAETPVKRELAAWADDHAHYLRVVRELSLRMKRPVIIGEFGLESTGRKPDTREKFEKLIADMEQADVDLAAFWVFDLKDQEGSWSVTFDNDRAFMLKVVSEANRRWNEAALRRIANAEKH